MLEKRRILIAVLLSTFVVGAAWAQTTGGHDETSEGNAALWTTGAPTPGVAPAPGISAHVILSEFVVTPTPAEFVEIYNPTPDAIDLSQYYLSDAWFEPVSGTPNGYHLLPTGTLVVGTNTDFVMKFPDGASIAPGETQVVALMGRGADSTYGAGTSDYEVTSTDAGIPDMINVGGVDATAGSTGLTNSSEFLVLFRWDGLSDNVCDVDYVTWGTATTTSRVDKSGIVVDGPDAGSTGTAYLADTPDASQSSVTAPGSPSSSARTSAAEGAEAAGGNGCLDLPTAASGSTWGKLKVRYR